MCGGRYGSCYDTQKENHVWRGERKKYVWGDSHIPPPSTFLLYKYYVYMYKCKEGYTSLIWWVVGRGGLWQDNHVQRGATNDVWGGGGEGINNQYTVLPLLSTLIHIIHSFFLALPEDPLYLLLFMIVFAWGGRGEGESESSRPIHYCLILVWFSIVCLAICPAIEFISHPTMPYSAADTLSLMHSFSNCFIHIMLHQCPYLLAGWRGWLMHINSFEKRGCSRLCSQHRSKVTQITCLCMNLLKKNTFSNSDEFSCAYSLVDGVNWKMKYSVLRMYICCMYARENLINYRKKITGVCASL